MDRQIDIPLKFQWNFIDGGREKRKKVNVKRGRERGKERETYQMDRQIERLRVLLSFNEILSMGKEKIER
jgi:hypothetical protein